MHRPEQVDPHHLSNASGIIAIDLIHLMADLISGLSQQIRKIEIELMKWHRADAVCQRLEAIPGIEFITATALAATVNDARAFRSGC
jgi:transposase